MLLQVLHDAKVSKAIDRKLDLSPDLWEMIKAMVTVLSPFKAFTELVSGAEYISLSLVYPKLRIIKRLLAPEDTDDEVISELKTQINQKLDIKFGNGLVNGKPCIALIATGLDPGKKSLKCVDTVTRELVKDTIIDMTRAILDCNVEEAEVNEPPAKRCRHDSQLASSSSDDDDIPLSSSSTRYLAIHEYEQFRKEKKPSDNVGPLKWWKDHESKYPGLNVLAKNVLAIPATSTASERVFSKAGLICSKLRSSLAPQNINILIFLAQNRDIYINEAQDEENE
jgi:hypothetical protein